ncbi:hypothetical protein BKA80DRAFT_122549 [Phyllosticta citrichinensis]
MMPELRPARHKVPSRELGMSIPVSPYHPQPGRCDSCLVLPASRGTSSHNEAQTGRHTRRKHGAQRRLHPVAAKKFNGRSLSCREELNRQPSLSLSLWSTFLCFPCVLSSVERCLIPTHFSISHIPASVGRCHLIVTRSCSLAHPFSSTHERRTVC